ncbi:pyridoxamine 5'-phosphate oxidase family protein [Microbacterium sp. NPDC096154]|uniref:pyridoxamine 5'-phosphate oxidase family protein n=1 Tax=Microbacterium sp. NPDC096154 TaxID=3155549 RepID=UPI00332D90E1
MIITLSEEECRELLTTASVGRLGFVHEGEVQVIPLNYLLHGTDLVLRTVPDGVVGTLAPHAERVAFEVDHLEAHRGLGWSVLMHGSLHAMTDAEISELADPGRVIPWVGRSRPLHLRFHAQSVSGRRVRRERTDSLRRE